MTSLSESGRGLEVTTPDGTIEAGLVFSTIPITVLGRFLDPPDRLRAALDSLRYRAMVLAYLVVPKERMTAYDAHYFPGADVPFTRLSEPKNYRDGADPSELTVLCAEIPCEPGDETWSSGDGDLLAMVRETVVRLGLPDPGAEGEVRRIRHAYPIYTMKSVAAFEQVAGWLESRERLVSYGRQGLYAHDNTHHALAMARDAVDCVSDDLEFDRARWAEARERFSRHVVED
jgi:protoporphyrinogen oxidase